MKKQIFSGTAGFNFEVSYKMIETGDGAGKPLILYLHGYKQNRHYFEKKCADLLSIEACHLFVQGPYPVYDESRKRKVEQWGRAWYLYDGEQEQFIQSMERTSIFLEKLIQEPDVKSANNRIIVLGYSMGGYLAGYFALSRPGLVSDLIVMGGRIKTEHFSGRSFDGLNALHIHGTHDKSVSQNRAQESCENLRKMGAEITFQPINESHKLSSSYIEEVKKWLQKRYPNS